MKHEGYQVARAPVYNSDEAIRNAYTTQVMIRDYDIGMRGYN